ncbi:MAG: hypothetical protein IPI64_08290 [Chloracidobacterium sp.]|nr:hypothetical protein [Chloracidobacterium sp.]
MIITADAAEEIAQLGEMLHHGYLAHHAQTTVASHSDAASLAPEIEDHQIVSVGYVDKTEGKPIEYSFPHFLKLAQDDPRVKAYSEQVWLAGALITLGDALESVEYLDHAPILEMIYHLRNGVAHGNKFRFKASGIKRLEKFPAHNRDSYIKGADTKIFEISTALEGQPVLFDFMKAGDVAEHLLAVGFHAGQLMNRMLGKA